MRGSQNLKEGEPIRVSQQIIESSLEEQYEEGFEHDSIKQSKSKHESIEESVKTDSIIQQEKTESVKQSEKEYSSKYSEIN